MSVVKVELAPGVEASLGLIQVDKKALHAESEIPFTLHFIQEGSFSLVTHEVMMICLLLS